MAPFPGLILSRRERLVDIVEPRPAVALDQDADGEEGRPGRQRDGLRERAPIAVPLALLALNELVLLAAGRERLDKYLRLRGPSRLEPARQRPRRRTCHPHLGHAAVLEDPREGVGTRRPGECERQNGPDERYQQCWAGFVAVRFVIFLLTLEASRRAQTSD